MAEYPNLITYCLELISISKNLERVGDLATNICEDTIFIAEARWVKHHATELPSPALYAPALVSCRGRMGEPRERREVRPLRPGGGGSAVAARLPLGDGQRTHRPQPMGGYLGGLMPPGRALGAGVAGVALGAGVAGVAVCPVLPVLPVAPV